MDETKSKEEEKVKLQRTLKVNNFIIMILPLHMIYLVYKQKLLVARRANNNCWKNVIKLESPNLI